MTERRRATLPRLALLVVLVGAVALLAAGPPREHSRFVGKTVVVTGANRGLGLEFVRQYLEAGADVVGTARRPEAAEELAATGARVVQLDVTDDASVAAFAEAVGDGPVHLLVNNAGINNTSLPRDLDRVERTRRIMDVNTLGPIRVTEALLPRLLASGEGATVVNISSGLASITNSRGGSPGYRESKAALNMYSRNLAAEHRESGLLVVPMSPGWVQTDMGGSGAPLTPAQSIAGMIAVIEELDADQSGEFLNHDGSVIPW